MSTKSFIFFLSFMMVAIAPMSIFAQGNSSLPVATTHEISGARIDGGEVVIYDEEVNQYAVSQSARDPRVYGVTAVRPALVFAVGSGTVPVVTAGAANVRVSAENGPIKRGDLLVSSESAGVAMVAEVSDDAVFAIALESFGDTNTPGATGTIAVEVGVEQARMLQESRREIEKQNAQNGTSSTSSAKEKATVISFVRAGLASVIAVGGLLFVLYSFRSTIAKGVVSIGRNPRARASILTLAVSNIIFALLLCAVVVFIAVGILILPLEF